MKLKVLIAGQEGMVGRSIYNLLKKKSKKFKLLNCKRKDLDFTNQLSVEKWFKKNKPNIVINAAGKVGGIMDNSKNQSDYIYINTMIGLNIINSAFKYNVKQLIMYYGSEWHGKFTCCRLKFGMYKNRTLQYILINDKSYLEWLHKNQNTINSLTDIDKNYINQIFICLN